MKPGVERYDSYGSLSVWGYSVILLMKAHVTHLTHPAQGLRGTDGNRVRSVEV